MKQDDIDDALEDLEEFYQIEFYEEAVYVIQSKDYVPWGYCDSVSSARMDTLYILIQAKLLSDEQLARIKKIDDYVLSHTMPESLQVLKDWLKTNAL